MRVLPCLSLLVVLFAAASASAGDRLVGGPCAAPADCPLAFSCESVELDCRGEDPGEVQCDCFQADCRDGEDCPPCDCGPSDEASDDCEPTVEQRCVFAPQDCTADTTCTTAGFVCHEMEECSSSGGTSGCACPPCDPDGGECPPCDCDEDWEESEEVEECTTIGGYCLPPEQPCATDADCGSDWECFDVDAGDRSCGCDCRPCADGADCEPCDCSGCDDEDGESMSEGMCLPPGWADQVDQMVGGAVGDSKWLSDHQESGSGAPNDGRSFGDDNQVRGSSCAAAGGGAGASALLVAAALVLVLRRR